METVRHVSNHTYRKTCKQTCKQKGSSRAGLCKDNPDLIRDWRRYFAAASNLLRKVEETNPGITGELLGHMTDRFPAIQSHVTLENQEKLLVDAIARIGMRTVFKDRKPKPDLPHTLDKLKLNQPSRTHVPPPTRVRTAALPHLPPVLARTARSPAQAQTARHLRQPAQRLLAMTSQYAADQIASWYAQVVDVCARKTATTIHQQFLCLGVVVEAVVTPVIHTSHWSRQVSLSQFLS
jgi:hypothetical protein